MEIVLPTKELIDEWVREAVAYFWQTRASQKLKQISEGSQDAGNRGSVTGGQQLNGFLKMFTTVLMKIGIQEDEIFTKGQLELPGYFRPTKQWDLVVVKKDFNGEKRLLAAIELKSQVGSFGNNFNNRTEEAMGSSVDIWTAFREGAFKTSRTPWLGYLMLLEASDKSTAPVKIAEPHFEVFEEFRNTSYAQRYELFCKKLVLERKYTSAAFIMSSQTAGIEGDYIVPNEELSVHGLISSLIGHVIGELNT